ncbi:MAG: hypothetical protein LCH37_15260 [Bacteroidetes bacterium]|nr:hypothetical protein [Bacteroidota bacterium]
MEQNQNPKNWLDTLFGQLTFYEIARIVGMLGFQVAALFYVKPQLFDYDPLIWGSVCVGYMFLNFCIGWFYSAWLIFVLKLDKTELRLQKDFLDLSNSGLFLLVSGASPLVKTCKSLISQDIYQVFDSPPVVTLVLILLLLPLYLGTRWYRSRLLRIEQNQHKLKRGEKIGENLKLEFPSDMIK